MRILLVDDDALAMRSLSRVLVNRGHQVTMVEGGTAALRELDRVFFDNNVPLQEIYEAVVSDVDMPDMNGFELKGAVRARCPSLKVVLHSGRPQIGVLLKGNINDLMAELHSGDP